MSEQSSLEQLKIDIEQLQSAVHELGGERSGGGGGDALYQCLACQPQCSPTPTNPDQPQFIPDFNIPLVASGGGDQYCAIQQSLGDLAPLLGTWVSPRYAGFNVMPIPQATAPTGFILKNIFYYEVMTFSAIQGKVANRAGTFEQDAYTIFYSQRVFFADGAQKDQLVHAENGSWLHQVMNPQGQGPLNTQPYIPSPPAPETIPPQDPTRAIVKQVSIPHGNSILALGGSSRFTGAPEIPVVSALPVDAPEAFAIPYGTDIPENLNINPNFVLEVALEQQRKQGIDVLETVALHVDTDNHGQVANTPFMQEFSNVPRFANTVWIEQLSNGLQQLQYSQNITLEFPLPTPSRRKEPAIERYRFPHITANTLYKMK